LFIHLLLSPLIFSRYTVEAFECIKVGLLLLVAIALAALSLIVHTQRLTSTPLFWPIAPREVVRRLARQPIVLGMLLLLGSAILSSATSLSPHMSFWGAPESYAGLLTVFAVTVLFFATRALCRTSAQTRRLLAAPVAASVMVSFYAGLQVAGADPIGWDRASLSPFGSYVRPFATLGHPNFLAAYLVMTLPLTALFAQDAARHRRWIVLAVLTFSGLPSALAIVTSLSRGAWLAAVAVSAMLLVGRGGTGWRRLVPAGVGGFIVLVIAGLLAVAGRSHWHGFLDRVEHVADLGARVHLWRAGWQMFMDHPLFGCGLDTFALAFEPRRTVAYSLTEWNTTPTRAHNEAIHILATQGLLGAAAVVLLSFGLIRACLRSGPRNTEDRRLLLVLVAVVVGFYFQDLVSFTVAACGTLFITVAALLSRMGESEPLPEPARQFVPGGGRRLLIIRVAQVGIGTAALIGAVQWVARPLAASCACQAADQALGADPHAAIRYLQRAVALDPGQTMYWVRLGTTYQAAAKGPRSPGERQRLLLLGRDALQRALALLPNSAGPHTSAGRLLAELAREGLAEPSQAFAEFDTALALEPNNALIYVEASNAAVALGRLDLARVSCQQGEERYPNFGPLCALPGTIALSEGRFVDADYYLNEALLRDWYGDETAFLTTLSMVALTYQEEHRFDLSLKAASLVLEQAPDWPIPRFTRALTLEKLGRRAEAIAEYRRIPDYGPARAALHRLGL
jgi:O-antigen ligase/tetratricopeptide (TPR) repeat protein